MDCDRCGGMLESYTLDGNEAHVCPDCGFADTAIEHEATPRPEPEPWETAMKRFHEQYVDSEVAVVGSGETAAVVAVDASDDEAEADDDVESGAAGEESAADPAEQEGDEGADAQPEEREKPA